MLLSYWEKLLSFYLAMFPWLIMFAPQMIAEICGRFPKSVGATQEIRNDHSREHFQHCQIRVRHCIISM